MTLAEYSIGAFAVLNGMRVFAYIPQILCVHRDGNGAVAVSVTTWTLFMAANIATVSYAIAVSSDLLVATVFSLNALGCLSIVVLIVIKRVAAARSAPALAGEIVQELSHWTILAMKLYGPLQRFWLRSAKRRLEIELRLTLPSKDSYPANYFEELSSASHCNDQNTSDAVPRAMSEVQQAIAEGKLSTTAPSCDSCTVSLITSHKRRER
jgi:hypothetical protein